MARTSLVLVLALAVLHRAGDAQSHLRVGFGAAGGIATGVGGTRHSYSRGAVALADLTFRGAGARLAVRLEALYFRVSGARTSGIAFPSVNVLAFTAGVMGRIGSQGHRLTPYAFAGLGPYNVQDALPFAAYRTRLGLHAGAGGALRLARIQLFVEARFVHIRTDPHTQLVPLVTGARWFP